MEIIFLLILISLIVAAGFLLAYFWAARNGQFDDDYTPAVRMLFDEELRPARAEQEKEEAP
ncbi:MAG: cbb3-type cytochrome oxidase assembly protein CcoS [Saprospiraceae bacterium]|nr:cbb3-type cytochrome oxidase assembly protein CcoS [Saprospiraceae bacterium]